MKRRQLLKTQSALLWILLGLNICCIVLFWLQINLPLIASHTISPWLAFGRLCGLLATFGALLQFVLMSRASWLEPIFGMDRIARFHRINGYTTFILLLVHPVLITLGYAALTGMSIVQTYISLLGLAFVPFAIASVILFVCVVGFTIYIVRKHLRFETWYYIHLMNYAAIILLPWHQFANGGTILSSDTFWWYWVFLYAATFLNLAIWRFGMPIYKLFRHQFRVDKIISEGPRANSVYISGKDMQSYRARGGQFVLVRFFQKGFWWQEHPFSLSRLPDEKGIRNTVRELGDFTTAIKMLSPGTRVLVSGPYGAFTLDHARHDKLLYIAGGIGITPIRSMIEEESSRQRPRQSILLYANRTGDDIALKNELDQLATKQLLSIHHVLSDDKNATESGIIDKPRLSRLVPDITKRSIFLCGPPPMMKAVTKSLSELGVDSRDIHYEWFSLHTK